MNADDRSGRRVALAAVAGAHGVKGDVRLKLFSDSADSLKAHAALFVGGVSRKVLQLNAASKLPIVRFEGVADRTAAEALRGSLVEVDRDALPPLEEGEYYHADLMGLPCFDAEGEPIGEVSAVENFGAGDLLEIRKSDGRTALVPFKPGIADLNGGRIVVDAEFLA